jgi:hypothetical protein
MPTIKFMLTSKINAGGSKINRKFIKFFTFCMDVVARKYNTSNTFAN